MSGRGRRVGALVVIAALHGGVAWAAQGQAEQGKKTFQTSCAGCHKIGGGRLVGPDLLGLNERRSEAWIIKFVQHSQRLVAAGDSLAVARFEEYQRFSMPDQPLSADEIRGVLAYIREAGASGATPAAVAEAVVEATEEQTRLGRALFQGHTRLANGGPACNACHTVTNDSVMGGGALAPELTWVFSRLGATAVKTLIRFPSFSVMRAAYQDKPLTDEEAVALVGFLRRMDEQHALYQPRRYGLRLLAAGAGGMVLLLGLYSLAWGGRSRGSVNQRIYDRQRKST